jgi:hypothetical protein
VPDPHRPDLAAELLRRMDADQHARGVRANGRNVAPDHELMRAVDTRNTAALQRIINAHGWPGHCLVGVQAARAAWLIAMHAQPDFQMRALGSLRRAIDHGEATPRQLAYLTDRCLMNQDRPQLYGTQYQDAGDGRGPLLWKVADPDRLDARRAEVGLGPHADHDLAIRENP